MVGGVGRTPRWRLQGRGDAPMAVYVWSGERRAGNKKKGKMKERAIRRGQSSRADLLLYNPKNVEAKGRDPQTRKQ